MMPFVRSAVGFDVGILGSPDKQWHRRTNGLVAICRECRVPGREERSRGFTPNYRASLTRF